MHRSRVAHQRHRRAVEAAAVLVAFVVGDRGGFDASGDQALGRARATGGNQDAAGGQGAKGFRISDCALERLADRMFARHPDRDVQGPTAIGNRQSAMGVTPILRAWPLPEQEEGPQITQIKRIKKIREASCDMTDCHGQPQRELVPMV